MGSAPPPPQASRTPLDPARGGDGTGAVFSGGYGKQDSESPAPSRASRKRNWLVPLLVLGGLGAGGAWLASHWGIEETDNAQLQGRLTEISSRVPGTIVRVFVDDNDEVKAGQPLILLDDRDAGVRLYRARADLEQVGREAQDLLRSGSIPTDPGSPGQVVALVAGLGLVVATGDGALLVRRGLLAGRRVSEGRLLLEQLQAQVGDRFAACSGAGGKE